MEARARSRYVSGRVEKTGPHDNSDTLDARSIAVKLWRVAARCGRVACVSGVKLLHVCSIYSTERGKRVRSSRLVRCGDRETGETLEAAVAFRNLTFPFCRLLTARPSLPRVFLSLSLSLEPFSSPLHLFFPQTLRSNTHDSSKNRRTAPVSLFASFQTIDSRPSESSPRRDDNLKRERVTGFGRLIGSLNYFPRSVCSSPS